MIFYLSAITYIYYNVYIFLILVLLIHIANTFYTMHVLQYINSSYTVNIYAACRTESRGECTDRTLVYICWQRDHAYIMLCIYNAHFT